MNEPKKSGGDAASVSTLRPRPEHMAEFLPLWNARIAHITAADAARARIELMRPDVDSANAAALAGTLPLHAAAQMAAKLQEQIDAAKLHDEEALACGAAMAALQFDPSA